MEQKRVKYNTETLFFFNLVKPVLRSKVFFRCIFNKENIKNQKITLSKWMKADTSVMNHDINNVKSDGQGEIRNNFQQLR